MPLERLASASMEFAAGWRREAAGRGEREEEDDANGREANGLGVNNLCWGPYADVRCDETVENWSRPAEPDESNGDG